MLSYKKIELFTHNKFIYLLNYILFFFKKHMSKQNYLDCLDYSNDSNNSNDSDDTIHDCCTKYINFIVDIISCFEFGFYMGDDYIAENISELLFGIELKIKETNTNINIDNIKQITSNELAQITNSKNSIQSKTTELILLAKQNMISIEKFLSNSNDDFTNDIYGSFRLIGSIVDFLSFHYNELVGALDILTLNQLELSKNIIVNKKIVTSNKENLFKINETYEKYKLAKSNTDDMSIVSYVNLLYMSGGLDNVFDTLRSKFFEVKQLLKSSGSVILKIKYLEHNKIWTKWGRQSRGVILRLAEPKNIFVCDKQMLIRGAEVLTNVHINADINSTQDIVDFKEKSYLNASQLDTIDKLLNSKPFDAYMSFKNDGSLLAVTLYPTNSDTGQFYINLILSHGDDFAKQILSLSQHMILPFVPIISTQGTLFLADDMKDYMTSAILIGGCGLSHDELNLIAIDNTPSEALIKYGKLFFYKLEQFYNLFKVMDKTNSMTLSFEAICKNRTANWPDSKVHLELATSYLFTDIRLLGCVFNLGDDVGLYKAHYQMSDEIASCGFDEPLYWKISHANEVDRMMNDLSRVIFNQINIDEYFILHPYENKHIPKNLSIDYEGWIIYRNLPDGTLDYSKIKSEEYYVSHIFREHNIPKLIQIAECKKGIFPLADITYDFFTNLNEKLYITLHKIKTLLDSENNDVLSGLPSKAIISFAKQNYQTKIKMLINASDTWNKICFDIFAESFDKIKETTDIFSTLKSIVMNVKPWESIDAINKNIDLMVIKATIPRNKNDKHQYSNSLGELFSQLQIV